MMTTAASVTLLFNNNLSPPVAAGSLPAVGQFANAKTTAKSCYPRDNGDKHVILLSNGKEYQYRQQSDNGHDEIGELIASFRFLGFGYPGCFGYLRLFIIWVMCSGRHPL